MQVGHVVFDAAYRERAQAVPLRRLHKEGGVVVHHGIIAQGSLRDRTAARFARKFHRDIAHLRAVRAKFVQIVPGQQRAQFPARGGSLVRAVGRHEHRVERKRLLAPCERRGVKSHRAQIGGGQEKFQRISRVPLLVEGRGLGARAEHAGLRLGIRLPDAVRLPFPGIRPRGGELDPVVFDEQFHAAVERLVPVLADVRRFARLVGHVDGGVHPAVPEKDGHIELRCGSGERLDSVKVSFALRAVERIGVHPAHGGIQFLVENAVGRERFGRMRGRTARLRLIFRAVLRIRRAGGEGKERHAQTGQ